MVKRSKGFEWEACPHCKEEEVYWWDHEGGYCQNGCFGYSCDSCGEIPLRGLYANGTYEIDGSMDVCPDCIESYPDALITDTPSSAVQEEQCDE